MDKFRDGVTNKIESLFDAIDNLNEKTGYKYSAISGSLIIPIFLLTFTHQVWGLLLIPVTVFFTYSMTVYTKDLETKKFREKIEKHIKTELEKMHLEEIDAREKYIKELEKKDFEERKEFIKRQKEIEEKESIEREKYKSRMTVLDERIQESEESTDKIKAAEALMLAAEANLISIRLGTLSLQGVRFDDLDNLEKAAREGGATTQKILDIFVRNEYPQIKEITKELFCSKTSISNNLKGYNLTTRLLNKIPINTRKLLIERGRGSHTRKAIVDNQK